jgi:hypothetical protein
MGDITSANSVLALGAQGVFPTPVQLQGFAADDAYSMASVEISENMIGVDGIKSSGFLPTMPEMRVVLQADSTSNDFFEAIYNAGQSAQGTVALFGTLLQPSIGKAYTLTNGTLKGYTPIAAAKKVLQAREFSIVFQGVSGAPTA